MRIVESHQAISIWPMKRERIVEAMRLGFAGRYATHDEPDPMIGIRIDNKNLPVQLEQSIE